MAAFFISFRSDSFGVAAPPSAAISVNIETSDILNSPEEDEQAPSSSAASYVPEVHEANLEKQAPEDTAPPPEPDPMEAAEKLKAEAEAKRLEEERDRERVAQEAAERERQDAERLRREEAKLAEQRHREEEAEKREAEQREQDRRKAEQAERIAREEARKRREQERGQNAAEASRGKQASKGRVSASRGSMLSYDATVRTRIARNKPRGSGGTGRGTVVTFKVSPSGSLAFLRILQSSGNAAQDQSALSAVRRSSPFPVPPAGATAKQLTYTLRFTYR
jgi:TonB family protein